MRSEIGRKTGYSDWERGMLGPGGKATSWCREGNLANFLGPFFSEWILKKWTLVSGYRESTLRYRSNVHECATTLIRSSLQVSTSTYSRLDPNTEFTAWPTLSVFKHHVACRVGNQPLRNQLLCRYAFYLRDLSSDSVCFNNSGNWRRP